jgi:hypothetical protein
LNNRDVAGGEVTREAVDVGVNLDAVVVGQRARVDPRSADGDHPQSRHAPPRLGKRLDHAAKQPAADARPAHGDDADPLVGRVAELGGGPRDRAARRRA